MYLLSTKEYTGTQTSSFTPIRPIIHLTQTSSFLPTLLDPDPPYDTKIQRRRKKTPKELPRRLTEEMNADPASQPL